MQHPALPPQTMSDQLGSLEDLFVLETLVLHPLCISALSFHLKALVLLLWTSLHPLKALVLLHPPSTILLNQVHLRPFPRTLKRSLHSMFHCSSIIWYMALSFCVHIISECRPTLVVDHVCTLMLSYMYLHNPITLPH